MKAGNIIYQNITELPDQIPVFPLSGALLLPGGQLPLNIFEPQYMEMFEDAVKTDRLIAMIQPLGEPTPTEEFSGDFDELYKIGCVGRITAFQESGDGRYLVNLSGICRYSLVQKVESEKSYKIYHAAYFQKDLNEDVGIEDVDREKLLATFKNYLEANQMEADWDNVKETDTNQLVNALCMMSPYGSAEKQAMLEAESMAKRAETLIAITEFELAKTQDGAGGGLQ